MTESYKLALEFAKAKHKGQKRIGGDDYITHPIAVSEIVKNQGFDEICQITALFHDLLEDTDATEEEILKYGNSKILEAVNLLTKKKGYDMAEYINAIKQNPIAFAVKAADRLHNLQCAVITDEEFKTIYDKAESCNLLIYRFIKSLRGSEYLGERYKRKVGEV